MSREDEFNKSFERPAARYLEWASDEKQFRYYDHDAEENVLIPLPLKFIVLMERHTVKGWHDDSESGIWANEVEDLSKEILTIKSFKGGAIAKGLYKNVKDTVADVGGHYSKSIYIMTDEGEIWNISIKGSAVFAWGEFIKKDRKRLIGELVAVTSVEEKKKGKVEYSIPVFEFKGKIKPAVAKKADVCYAELVENLSARAQSLANEADDKSGSDEEIEELDAEDVDFDMPNEEIVNF